MTIRWLCCFFLMHTAFGAGGNLSPTGLWKTVDDKTGRPRGTVRIYEKNGLLFGKAESAFNPAEVAEICDRCSGERHNQRVLGMVILWNLKRNGDGYSGGEILDPDSGYIYRCKLTLADGGEKLLVRGYVGISIAGRSQTWQRVKEHLKAR